MAFDSSEVCAVVGYVLLVVQGILRQAQSTKKAHLYKLNQHATAQEILLTTACP